jgi:hypothetical protein
MIKKRILFLVIILSIISIIVYIFRPISFGKEFSNADEITVLYPVNLLDKDGKYKPDFKSLTFYSNSTKFHEIKNIIENYSYHKCFKTWINDGQLNGVHYQISTNEKRIVIAENSYIIIDSNIYRVGYFGNLKVKKMITELNDLLKTE